MYKIVLFKWRNAKVTEFLHALDARIRDGQRKDRTIQMRKRRVSKRYVFWSTRPAPQGLPKDWYNAEWLAHLEETDPLGYAELRVAPPLDIDWDKLIK